MVQSGLDSQDEETVQSPRSCARVSKLQILGVDSNMRVSFQKQLPSDSKLGH